MLNNTCICPNCRSPLPTHTCKKCGYKQKILKVAEFQEDFGRRHYANKIQTSKRENSSAKLLTPEQKLSIYLKQYQMLIIKGAERLIEVNQLNIPLRQQFKRQAKFIWQKYLFKIKETELSFLGILKKPKNEECSLKANTNRQQLKMKEIKESDEEKQEQINKKQAQELQELHQLKRKRGRPSKYQIREKQETANATKLRCYFNVSVKPLVTESVQERKNDSIRLTPAQKSFLSFNVGLKQIDEEFLRIASNKYLKLILQIDGNKIEKSFVKEPLINIQLKKRNLPPNKDRSKAILLIMLYDTLLCINFHDSYQQSTISLQQLILHYRNSQPDQAIDRMLSLVNKEQKRQRQHVPQLCYGLIYAIMYLSTTRLGLTISVGQILTQIGALQISRINVEQDFSLPAVANQQVISGPKTRRMAHLLAKFLNLDFPVVITKWCRKWCTKFDLLAELPILSQLNRLFFKQVLKKGLRKRPNIQQSQKYQNYYKYCQLQQDLASLGSLLIYLKLIDGLSDYPYLIHIRTQQLKKEYKFQDQTLNMIEKLIKNKQITVQNIENEKVCTKSIPDIYRSPLDLLKFSKKIAQINQSDKFLGYKLNNSRLIRFRNLAHINQVNSMQLLEALKQFKQSRGQKQSEDAIKLRYNEMPHKQWTHELAKLRKVKTHKILKQHHKPQAQLSEDLKKQLGCIISAQQIIADKSQDKSDKKIECLVDDPSRNYQLMYEYTSDNLVLAQRCEQLYVMQQLCLNVCSYNELIVWVHSYQCQLKKMQT